MHQVVQTPGTSGFDKFLVIFKGIDYGPTSIEINSLSKLSPVIWSTVVNTRWPEESYTCCWRHHLLDVSTELSGGKNFGLDNSTSRLIRKKLRLSILTTDDSKHNCKVGAQKQNNNFEILISIREKGHEQWKAMLIWMFTNTIITGAISSPRKMSDSLHGLRFWVPVWYVGQIASQFRAKSRAVRLACKAVRFAWTGVRL